MSGSPLARIYTGNGQVQVAVLRAGVKDNAFWDGGRPPPWADGWGRDDFGAWVEFSVEDAEGQQITQRMRWIEPGSFLTGSPGDEPGRWNDEGPQHEVTIGVGFWLFDTPCTQALWQAVMGENPSRFQTPERPVEQVSWDEVREFIGRINASAPGLELGLPSEAQWEYACRAGPGRAGTGTALYTGDIEILGQRNAPALDPIAWYGGNSGEGFELEDGWDTSDWKEQQYPNDRAGTRPVGGKQSNQWGLYDMLGNVWEWVQDSWHDRYDGAPTDGSAWESGDTGADRVVHGGSWFNYTRDCRPAYRYRFRPVDRSGDLGFRCARAQAS